MSISLLIYIKYQQSFWLKKMQKRNAACQFSEIKSGGKPEQASISLQAACSSPSALNLFYLLYQYACYRDDAWQRARRLVDRYSTPAVCEPASSCLIWSSAEHALTASGRGGVTPRQTVAGPRPLILVPEPHQTVAAVACRSLADCFSGYVNWWYFCQSDSADWLAD